MYFYQGTPGNLIGLTEAAANTPWFAVVPGLANAYTRLNKLQVQSLGATENGLYLMRPIGQATILNAQVATDTSLTLDRDPSATGNAISNGDVLVYLASDGTYRKITATGAISSLVLPVSSLPAAVSANSTVWNFGIYTDTEPTTGLAFPKLYTPASEVKDYDLGAGFGGFGLSQPLIVYSPNATHKTNLNFASYLRTNT